MHTDLSGVKSTKNREFSLRISSYYDFCILIVRTCAIGHERVKGLLFWCFVSILWMVFWTVEAYVRRDGCVELLELYKLIGQIRTQRSECTTFLHYTYFSCTFYCSSSSLITAKRVRTLETCLANLCKLNNSEDFLTAIYNVVGTMSSRNS